MRCGSCNTHGKEFLLLGERRYLCLECKDGAIPENIDLVQIAVAESGTCPMCQAYVHQFMRPIEEESAFSCPECGVTFQVYCLQPLMLQYIGASLGRKMARPSARSTRKELDVVAIFEKRLVESLSKVRSPDDFRAAFSVDYFNYRQYARSDSSVGVQLAALDAVLEMVLQFNNPRRFEEVVVSRFRQVELAAARNGIKAVSAIAKGFGSAFSRLCSGTVNSSYSDHVPLTCPACKLSYRWRSYIVMLDTALPLYESKDYLSSACPGCGDDFTYCFSLVVIRKAKGEAVFFVEEARGEPDAQGWKVITAFCLLNDIDFGELEKIRYEDINEFRWHFHPKRGTSEWMRMLDRDLSHALNVLRALGASYTEHKGHMHALECYQLAAIFDPTCRENYQGIASAYTALSRFEEALMALEKKMSITDREGRYFYVPASPTGVQVLEPPEWAGSPTVHASTKRVIYRVLVRCLNQYLEMYPMDCEKCAFLAGAYGFLGEKQDSLKAALKTSAIDPLGAWTDFAKMYLDKSDIVNFVWKREQLPRGEP